MDIYGQKRIIRSRMNRRVHDASESRDGIIWSVDFDKHIAYVKIQGSDTLISAHFPQNWSSIPYWLKPNMAVRIGHRGGLRGNIEVLGEGKAIPTPMKGNLFPDPG